MDAPKKHLCPREGCDSSFSRPYRLAQHILTHDNVKVYACAEANCGKSYSSKSHLDRHINTAHKESEVDVIYSCPICMKKYINRQNLKRHIKIHHKMNIQFSCDSCKLEFRKKHLLSAHMYEHTGVKAFSSREPLTTDSRYPAEDLSQRRIKDGISEAHQSSVVELVCEVCPEDFVSLYEKKRHIRYHKTHTCSKCSKVFQQWSKYQKHIHSEHEPTDFTCDICGRNFKARHHLVRHMKIHDLSRVFPCHYSNCTRFYSRNSNLRQHILTKHEGIKHPCTICEAQLSTKAKLNEHIQKIHVENGPKKRIAKTKATGRKTRKDRGIPRIAMALKLSGIQKSENLQKDHPEVSGFHGTFGEGAGGPSFSETNVFIPEITIKVENDIDDNT